MRIPPIFGRRRFTFMTLHCGEHFAMLPMASGTHLSPSPHTHASFGRPVTFLFTSVSALSFSILGSAVAWGSRARHWITRL
jgi:hypothetical protein